MWGTSNWNQPGQQQPNQWPMPMQSDDLAVRAAEWAKQRLAMENQSQQQSMQGVPLQQHFGTGGTSLQMPPPTVPTSLGSATDVFPPPLMGQPYPGSFTSQQPPGPSPFGGGGMHEDKMDLDDTRGGVSTVPPPLMGQQLMQGVHSLPQPDVAQYAPPQPPTPANPPPTQSYINEPSGTHYTPSVGQSSASFQPLPTPGGSYQPQVETKPPLLATPPNTGYNPQTQVFAPESLYIQQGGQPFHQEQAYPGQGFISESILHPASDLKKKTLPAWVKEGLVKMYREKQKEEEKETKLREMELTKTQGGGPRWSVDDDSDSGGEGDKPAQDPPEEERSDVDGSAQPRGILKKSVVSEATVPDSQHPEEEEESDSDSHVSYEGQTALSEEELLQKVRKMTIELLLEVTGDEIADVASEVLQEMRGSRTNEKPTSSVHTRTLLGIGAYESDSSRSSGDDDGGSDDDDKNNQSLKLKKKALTNPYSSLPVPRDVDGSLRNDTIQKAFNPDEQEAPNSNETSMPRGRTQDKSDAKLLSQTHPQILHQTALQRDPNTTVADETKSNKSPPHRESSGDSGSSSSSEAGRSRTEHHRGRVGRKRSRTRSNSRGERSTSQDRRSLSKEQKRRGSLSHAKVRKGRSRSRSKDGKRQSRSRSRDRKIRSRSRSRDRKKRFRSRSRDRKRRSQSTSKGRKKRSRSRSRDRKRRSRSRSKDRKRRSRSRSKDRKRRSRSRSKDRNRRSRSRSKDRKRQSRSRSRDRQRRSLSRSKDRRRRSRSRSKDRWKRSRSRSMDGYRRSRSRSKDQHRRSQSRSRDGGRRSRSTSKDRRRRSQSRSKDRRKRSRSRSADRRKHSPSWLKGTRSSRSRDTQEESHTKPSTEYMSSRREQQLLSPPGSLSKSLAPSSVKRERDKASRDSKLGKHRHISSSSGSESEALRSSSSSSSTSSESSDNSSSGSIKKKKSKKEHISKKSKATKSTKKGSTRKKRSPSLDTSRSSSRVSGRKKVEHSPPLRDRTHGRDKNGSEPRSTSRKKKH